VRAADRAVGVALAVGFAGFALLAILSPLAAYSLALAAFGLPHVISELRYVDRRFGRRLGAGLVTMVLAMLAVITAIRTATVLHAVPPEIGVPAELAAVAVMILACAQGAMQRKAVAITAGILLAVATLLAPFDTAVALSVLHNLTPLALLWQLAPGGRRRRIMLPATALLLGLPLLIATGLPRLALLGAAAVAGGSDPLDAGPLARHLSVYVPRALEASHHAIDLFTAAVVAQGGHYIAVIVVLPMLLARLDPSARGLLPWPRGGSFAGLILVIALASLAAFFQAFGEARAIYGIAASFHAWIELPIIILALTSAQPSSSPKSNEPALAMSETSMAWPIVSRAIQPISTPSTSTTIASSRSSAGSGGKRS
jgi:hypothetical protein